MARCRRRQNDQTSVRSAGFNLGHTMASNRRRISGSVIGTRSVGFFSTFPWNWLSHEPRSRRPSPTSTATRAGIRIVGIDNQVKVRDITVYCSDDEDLRSLVKSIGQIEGIQVLEVRDDVLDIHRRGPIQVVSRIPITQINDLQMLYTPGVASVCEKIKADPQAAWDLTGRCDRVAIVTNGTAVLGLGDIGVLPALTVMEGKAAIFAEFTGIGAFPLSIDSKAAEMVVEAAAAIAPSFGAIQLEDIAAPACFKIEEKLQARLEIPVCHDDQHGTSTVLLAALINAMKLTGKQPQACAALILGAGAAGFAIAKILRRFGISDFVVYDSQGPCTKVALRT